MHILIIEYAPLLGHLYPAMKKSIKTMRKGEIIELTVKPACKFDKHDNKKLIL